MGSSSPAPAQQEKIAEIKKNLENMRAEVKANKEKLAVLKRNSENERRIQEISETSQCKKLVPEKLLLMSSQCGQSDSIKLQKKQEVTPEKEIQKDTQENPEKEIQNLIDTQEKHINTLYAIVLELEKGDMKISLKIANSNIILGVCGIVVGFAAGCFCMKKN